MDNATGNTPGPVPRPTTFPRTAHSVLGFGRLIVEFIDANRLPKTGRLEDIATGTHVSAIGRVTTVTPIPSLIDPAGDPVGAWVVITATDGTKANLHVPADRYQQLFGDLVEDTRVEVYGTVLEGDDFSPPLIEARTVRSLPTHPQRLTTVGGAR